MSERMYQERTIREDRISELAAVYEIKKDDPDCPPFVKKIGRKWEKASAARDKESVYWRKLRDASDSGQELRYWFYKKMWEKYRNRDCRITEALKAETSTPQAQKLAAKYYLQYVNIDWKTAMIASTKKRQEEAKRKAKERMRKQKIRMRKQKIKHWLRLFKNE